jgi:hypothetical protein
MRHLIVAVALAGLAGCQAKDAAPVGHAPKAPAVVQSDAPASGAAKAPASKAPTSKAPASAAQAAPMPAVEVELPPDAKASGETLADDILNDQLDRRAGRDRTNAAAFLYLAAKHPDPKVVRTAILGMSTSFVRKARAGEDERGVDASYAAVVEARLAAKHAGVRAAAIQATRMLIGGKTPQAGWIDKVLAQLEASTNVGDQLALLRMLYTVRAFQLDKPVPGGDKAKIAAPVIKIAQGPAGVLRTAALNLLTRVAYPGFPQRDALLALATTLSTDADAATRGLALALRARLANAGDAVGPVMLAALKDPAPFVRGSAVAGIARLKYKAGVPALMALLEDTASCDLAVGGWTTHDGKPGSFKVRSGLGHNLANASFRAIRAIAGPALKITPPATPNARSLAAARVDAARAWFKANKGKLK